MQRHFEIILDKFGNPASGATFEVFQTGTASYATIFVSDSNDNPTAGLSQPITVAADGRVAFAINDGDYDLKVTYPDASTWTRYRLNYFDSSTATTVPVSSIALAMPAQFAVAGSPGTSMTVTWQTQTANTGLLGPTGGGPAVPTFRAFVAADINGVAVDLSTNQTAAGNKSWSGTATFNGAVTCGSTFTANGAASFLADVAFGTNVDLSLDKTSRIYVGSPGNNAWKAVYASLEDTTLVSGTLPTATTITGGVRGWACSAGATNELQYVVVLPFDYAEGTDVYPFIQWCQSATGAGDVRWGIEYTVIPSYSTGAFPATATITVTPTAPGVANELELSEFAAITGTTFLPNTMFKLRVFRDGSNGADTLPDTAFLLAVGLHYSSNRLWAKNKTPNFYT